MAEQEYRITNCSITEFKKLEGTGSKGPWVLFVFKTNHPRMGGEEFSYFAPPTKPETWPYDGVGISELIFTIGEYNGEKQNRVKKLLYSTSTEGKPATESAGESLPATTSKPSVAIGKDQLVCVSYVKDLAIAMLEGGMSVDQVDEKLSAACDTVIRNGFLMYLDLKTRIEKEA